MDFGGGGDDEALKRAVIDNVPGPGRRRPEKRGIDRPFDEIDEIGAPIGRHSGAAKGHERGGAALESLAKERVLARASAAATLADPADSSTWSVSRAAWLDYFASCAFNSVLILARRLQRRLR